MSWMALRRASGDVDATRRGLDRTMRAWGRGAGRRGRRAVDFGAAPPATWRRRDELVFIDTTTAG